LEPIRTAAASPGAYRIARLAQAGATNDLPAGTRVLVPDEPATAESRVLLPVPSTISDDAALIAPPLALALYIWDRLELELGELAIVSGNSLLSKLLGRVAAWRGAVPILGIGANLTGIPAARTLPLEDLPAVQRELMQAVKSSHGFAAVDLTGSPDLLDVLFEVLPSRARVALSGVMNVALTVDFYNNVHRKGIQLCTLSLTTDWLFRRESPHELEPALGRAWRVLANPELARQCLDSSS
jgi:threonine dehydrogenase-like Zn-dependent dehydrogenase